MINSLDKHIEDIKSKINESVFSPQFTRLANFYYLNGQYDECAEICRTGISIYPEYLTAKLILLKALIKLDYLNDAENLLNEIDLKISNINTLRNYKETISELKKLSRQEKICYPNKNISITEFKDPFADNYSTENAQEIDFDELLNIWSKNEENKAIDKIHFKKFEDTYNNYKLKKPILRISDTTTKQSKQNGSREFETLHFLKIKMVTETFGDLLSNQGFYKEAFNIYNSLLDTENSNKKRLLDKLTELERNIT